MKTLKTKQQMYFHRSSPVFTVVVVISLWTHYNYDDYKMKICALLISFWSGIANENNFELKKVFEYSYPNYVIIAYPKTTRFCGCITKRGLNNMQKKKTFLRFKGILRPYVSRERGTRNKGKKQESCS